jgi:hypothetical protein
MKKLFAVTALLCGVFFSLPAAAALQHFGYVFNGENSTSLDSTEGFTNFAHTVAETPQDSAFLARVQNINSYGLKATIDLGKIFWCGSNYNYLCSDWQTRWNTWKSYNSSILTSSKVLAVTVRDEPLLYGASLSDMETAAAYIKSDTSLSWLKIWYVEAACRVVTDQCGNAFDFNNAFANTTTTLPSIDWIGIIRYYIDPVTDSTFNSAVSAFKAKWSGKGWMYIGDGFWTGQHDTSFGNGNHAYMETIAQRWYDVARNDSSAVLFGFFLWPSNLPSERGTYDMPLNVLGKHIAIGRTITGKTRAQTSLPIGRLEDIPDGTGRAYGYACDPDGAFAENPQVDLYMNGNYLTTASYLSRTDYVANSQCSGGIAFRFSIMLPIGSIGQNITAVARDLDSGSVTLQSNCSENPACVWY